MTSLTNAMQLRTLFANHAWLSCRSNYFTTVSQTSNFMQVSPFSSTLRKGHLSWHSVFECLETSLLCWRQFGMRKIRRFSHAFPLTQNIFVNSTPILKLYSAWSCADAMFPLGNFGETSSVLSQSCMCKAQPKTNLHISVTCGLYLKLVSVSSSPKSSGYSLEKLERLCLLLLGFPLVSLHFFFFLFFHKWQNPDLWEAIRISGMSYWFWWFSGTNMVEP